MNSVENMNVPKVIAVVGPTASGKTALSIDLAKHFDGEVISADSRQVYRGLDIGTEKITSEEMRGVPHHLIDVADPTEMFTAADFKRLGERAMLSIAGRGHVPLVVGGTGFYIQALLDGVTLPEVPPHEALRSELERKTTDELFQLLQSQDPDRSASVDPHNRRRLIRALEIVAALGRVPAAQPAAVPYETLYIGIETPDEILKSRIARRLDEQLARGLLDEVEKLRQTLSRERLNEFGYEYRLTADFLEKKLTREELQKELTRALWHYAKRQRTWFKRDNRIRWFTLEQQSEITEMVANFLGRPRGGR